MNNSAEEDFPVKYLREKFMFNDKMIAYKMKNFRQFFISVFLFSLLSQLLLI